MAHINANSKITVSSIINEFIADVTNRIMAPSVLHQGYVIRSPYTGVEVVPSSILGNKNRIPTPSIGNQSSRMNANTIYNGLIEVTRYLLRVGEYSYSESMSVTGSWPGGAPSSKNWGNSGRALFSDDYAAQYIGNPSTAKFSPDIVQNPVLTINIISGSELINLMQRCFNSWQSSTRPRYSKTHTYCHASCHSNCHRSCHSKHKKNNDPSNPHAINGNNVCYNNNGVVHCHWAGSGCDENSCNVFDWL